jgi:hypothetical protein
MVPFQSGFWFWQAKENREKARAQIMIRDLKNFIAIPPMSKNLYYYKNLNLYYKYMACGKKVPKG